MTIYGVVQDPDICSRKYLGKPLIKSGFDFFVIQNSLAKTAAAVHLTLLFNIFTKTHSSSSCSVCIAWTLKAGHRVIMAATDEDLSMISSPSSTSNGPASASQLPPLPPPLRTPPTTTRRQPQHFHHQQPYQTVFPGAMIKLCFVTVDLDLCFYSLLFFDLFVVLWFSSQIDLFSFILLVSLLFSINSVFTKLNVLTN